MKIVEVISECECHVDFNGRIIILYGDREVRFINKSLWEDGTIPTPDEKIQIVKELYVERGKKKSERLFGDVVVFDGIEENTYGEAIDYNDKFEPLYKIVNNNIMAYRTDCECNQKYPVKKMMVKDFLTMKKQIKKDKLLKRIKHSIMSKKETYECTKCKQKWEFSEEYQSHGSWYLKKNCIKY